MTTRERPAMVCVWCTPPRVIRLGTLPASHGMCDACLALTNQELERLEQEKNRAKTE